MASGFFALLDDIAALMDDVAVMSKVAAKKTAGILGDDLAVNAEKSSGFVSSREIPVLWAIGKGSALNKLIILPVAFLLSAFWEFGVVLVLLAGGIYLAFEGAEKIYHTLFPHPQPETVTLKADLTEEEIVIREKEKIRSAIVTDFILSVEIIIIALGTVVKEPLMNQILVVTFIAILATVGVYGIVALIVRMDDFGYALIRKSKSPKSLQVKIGTVLVNALPWVIKSLAVIGTIALLLVAGGIFTHHITYFHPIFTTWPAMAKDFTIGLGVGLIALLIVQSFKFIYNSLKK